MILLGVLEVVSLVCLCDVALFIYLCSNYFQILLIIQCSLLILFLFLLSFVYDFAES